MRIAVTGGAGRVGGRVVRQLSAFGEHEVLAITRQVAAYEDPVALRKAMDGVDTLVFVSSDGEAAKVLLHHQNVLNAAVDSNVGHVVFLSGIDADTRSPFCFAFTNGYTEECLRDSGLDFTIAQASIFTEFFLSLVRQAAADGVVRLPAAGAGISLVSRDDVADCLAALAVAPPTGNAVQLTGPECLTAEAIATRAGFKYAEATAPEFAASLTAAGEETWWVHAYASMFASIREHRWEPVTDNVRRLLSRPPTALARIAAG